MNSVDVVGDVLPALYFLQVEYLGFYINSKHYFQVLKKNARRSKVRVNTGQIKKINVKRY